MMTAEEGLYEATKGTREPFAARPFRGSGSGIKKVILT